MEVFVRIAWVGKAFSSLVRVRLVARRLFPACAGKEGRGDAVRYDGEGIQEEGRDKRDQHKPYVSLNITLTRDAMLIDVYVVGMGR